MKPSPKVLRISHHNLDMLKDLRRAIREVNKHARAGRILYTSDGICLNVYKMARAQLPGQEDRASKIHSYCMDLVMDVTPTWKHTRRCTLFPFGTYDHFGQNRWVGEELELRFQFMRRMLTVLTREINRRETP